MRKIKTILIGIIIIILFGNFLCSAEDIYKKYNINDNGKIGESNFPENFNEASNYLRNSYVSYLKQISTYLEVGIGDSARGGSVEFSGDENNDFLVIKDKNANELIKIRLAKDVKIEYDRIKQELKITGQRIFSIAGSDGVVRKFDGLDTDSIFRIGKNGELNYAEFTSKYGGNYEIEYKGKKYLFKTKEKGKVMFDPEKKKITGENIESFISNGEVKSSKKFEAEIDENGKISKIFIDKGEFVSIFGEVFSSKKGNFNVFFTEQDLSKVAGDAVYIGDKKNTFKGTIIVDHLSSFRNKDAASSNFHFEGRSDDSLVDFNKETSIFDVKSGNSMFHNFKHEVVVENGEAKLKLRDKTFQTSDSFGFTYTNRENAKISGFLDEKENSYAISATLPNGKNFAYSVPLSNIGNSFTENSALIMQTKDFQKKLIESEISRLQTELGKAKDNPTKEKIQLDILKSQVNLGILDGETYANSKYRIEEFLKTSNEPSIKAEALSLIADLATKNSAGFDIPKMFRITTQTITGASLGGSLTTPQALEFEVNSQNKVVAYIVDGKRYEYNGQATEKPTSLTSDSLGVIDSLIYNRGSLNALRQAGSLYIRNSFETLGFGRETTEYLQAVGYSEEARKFLEIARANAVESGNKELVSRIDFGIAESYIASRDYDKANELLSGLSPKENSDSIMSRATMMLASIKYQEDPIKNAQEIYDSLTRSIYMDPTNDDARNMKDRLKETILAHYRNLAFSESKLTDANIDAMLGAGHGNERWFMDAFSIALQPATNAYLGSQGKIDELLKQQQANYNLGNERWVASTTLERLTQNGVDLRGYAEGTNLERFRTIYEANHYTDSMSLAEIDSYMKRAGIDSTNPNSFQAGIPKMMELIASERSSEASSKFQTDAMRALFLMNSVDKSIQNDATLYKLVAGETSIANMPFLGNSNELSSALSRDRIGTEIKLSGKENALLIAADVVLSPVSYIGLSSAYGAGKTASFFGREIGGQALLGSGADIVSRINPELGLVVNLGAGLYGLKGAAGEKKLNLAYETAVNEVGEARAIVRGTTKNDVNAAMDYYRGTKGFKEEGNGVFTHLETGQKVHVTSSADFVPEGFQRVQTSPIAVENAGEDLVQTSKNIEGEAKQRDIAISGAATESRAMNPETGLGTGCFLANTKITMFDNSQLNIQDILKGNYITAFDIYEQKPVKAEITETFVRNETEYYIIDYEIK